MTKIKFRYDHEQMIRNRELTWMQLQFKCFIKKGGRQIQNMYQNRNRKEAEVRQSANNGKMDIQKHKPRD